MADKLIVRKDSVEYITPIFKMTGIVEHADNAAALVAGLVAGDIYRTGDLLKIVH